MQLITTPAPGHSGSVSISTNVGNVTHPDFGGKGAVRYPGGLNATGNQPPVQQKQPAKPAPKKHGSGWIVVLIVAAIVAGAVAYFYTPVKNEITGAV